MRQIRQASGRCVPWRSDDLLVKLRQLGVQLGDEGEQRIRIPAEVFGVRGPPHLRRSSRRVPSRSGSNRCAAAFSRTARRSAISARFSATSPFFRHRSAWARAESAAERVAAASRRAS